MLRAWWRPQQKCQKSLNLIIVATKELFDLLQCDRASGADLLGESGIMPVTLMPHLGECCSDHLVSAVV